MAKITNDDFQQIVKISNILKSHLNNPSEETTTNRNASSLYFNLIFELHSLYTEKYSKESRISIPIEDYSFIIGMNKYQELEDVFSDYNDYLLEETNKILH